MIILKTSQKDIIHPQKDVYSPKQSLDLTTNLSEIQRREEHRKWYHGYVITNIKVIENYTGKKTWFLQQQQITRKQREETYRLKDT